MKLLVAFCFTVLFAVEKCQGQIMVYNENGFLARSRPPKVHRQLSACNTFTNCTSCMKEDLCLWSSGVCSPYASSEKTMSQYATCKTEALSGNYCHGYFGETKNFPSSKITLRHKESGGSIEPGIYCDWKFDTHRKYVYKVTIQKSNNNSQEFLIILRGSKGESLTFKDEDFNNTSSSFTFYNAVTIEVETMQKIGGVVSVYDITLEEYDNKTSTALLGLLTILLSVCICLIICTCFITMLKACFKVKEHNRRVRNLQHMNNIRQQEHESRAKKLLEENPPLMYKNINVKFEQTQCVICIEDFKVEDNEKVRIMPECNHVFHSECIEQWFNNRSNDELLCPLCNIKVLTKYELKEKLEKERIQKEKEKAEQLKNSESFVVGSGIRQMQEEIRKGPSMDSGILPPINSSRDQPNFEEEKENSNELSISKNSLPRPEMPMGKIPSMQMELSSNPFFKQ
ncbi:unnamed protein product [Moneuplotes crassus]|uniref:RING-type domain-containing protein n=2 Tax=Euplotes crassus TaxID=5936 RepID=A0AAD1UCP4_EUPCR|nr:unnamed protein product [Moneuplotes crassus]